MKKLTLLITLVFFGLVANAQKPAYEKAMTDLVSQISGNDPMGMLQPLANKMQRIASAEKEEWLPNYWVAYCYINDSFKKQDAGERDQLLDVAEEALENAEKLGGENNSEIEVLKANFASARLAVDGVNRWQEYGPKFEKALSNAKKFNPENPRISYLRGTNAFYTPEGFGGGKHIAKPLFETAIEKFNNFEPETPYSPNWGKMESMYFLSQCK